MERQNKAIEIFNNGYNCSQAVLLASEGNCDQSILKCLAAGFGAGMGKLN
jgi:hypothetical protein